MTTSGVFPKVDGDVLYSHDVNGLIIKWTDRTSVGSTITSTTPTTLGSSLISNINGGMLLNFRVIGSTQASTGTIYGYSSFMFSGVNTGNWSFMTSKVGDVSTDWDDNLPCFGSGIGGLISNLSTNNTEYNLSTPLFIPVKDDNIVFLYKGYSSQAGSLTYHSPIKYQICYLGNYQSGTSV